MKIRLHYDEKINGIIKDVLLIALLFILFSFIGIEVAIFVGIICASILLIRRIVLDLNPGHGKNKKIICNGKQLSVPQNTEIFELKDYTSFETLRKYAEALRFISIPPAILIIRFNGLISLDESSAKIICQVIKQLSGVEIRTVFADIDVSLYNQFEFYDILHIVEGKNLFSNIEDALKAGKKLV